MAFIEIDVNDRAQEFLDNVETIRERSLRYEMPVGAVGRWGSDRICKDGIREEELELEYINHAYEVYGNVSEAAESLSMTPSTFVRKRQKYSGRKIP